MLNITIYTDYKSIKDCIKNESNGWKVLKKNPENLNNQDSFVQQLRMEDTTFPYAVTNFSHLATKNKFQNSFLAALKKGDLTIRGFLKDEEMMNEANITQFIKDYTRFFLIDGLNNFGIEDEQLISEIKEIISLSVKDILNKTETYQKHEKNILLVKNKVKELLERNGVKLKDDKLIDQLIIAHHQDLMGIVRKTVIAGIPVTEGNVPKTFLLVDPSQNYNLINHNGELYFVVTGSDFLLMEKYYDKASDSVNEKVAGKIICSYRYVMKLEEKPDGSYQFKLKSVESDNEDIVNFFLDKKLNYKQVKEKYCSDDINLKITRDEFFKAINQYKDTDPEIYKELSNLFVQLGDHTYKKKATLIGLIEELTIMAKGLSQPEEMQSFVLSVKEYLNKNPIKNPIVLKIFTSIFAMIDDKKNENIEKRITSSIKGLTQEDSRKTLSGIQTELVTRRKELEQIIKEYKKQLSTLKLETQQKYNNKEDNQTNFQKLLGEEAHKQYEQYQEEFRAVDLIIGPENLKVVFSHIIGSSRDKSSDVLIKEFWQKRNASSFPPEYVDAVNIFIKLISTAIEAEELKELHSNLYFSVSKKSVPHIQKLSKTEGRSSRAREKSNSILQKLEEEEESQIKLIEAKIANKIEEAKLPTSPLKKQIITLEQNFIPFIKNNKEWKNNKPTDLFGCGTMHVKLSQEYKEIKNDADKLRIWMKTAIERVLQEAFDAKGNINADIKILYDIAIEENYLDKVGKQEFLWQYVFTLVAFAKYVAPEEKKLLNDIFNETIRSTPGFIPFFALEPTQGKLPYSIDITGEDGLIAKLHARENPPEDVKEKPAPIKNKWLKAALDKNFVEAGSGGIKQVKNDYVKGLKFRCNQIKHLGFSPEGFSFVPSYIKDQVPKDKISLLLDLENNKQLITADDVVNSHSQGTAASLPFILSHAINEGIIADNNIQFMEPSIDLMYTNLRTDEDGNVLLEVEGNGFVLGDNKNSSNFGFMDAKYKLTYRMNKERNGYDLLRIDTDNKDIYNILNGNQISEDQLKEKYFTVENKLKGLVYRLQGLPFTDKSCSHPMSNLLGFIKAQVILDRPTQQLYVNLLEKIEAARQEPERKTDDCINFIASNEFPDNLKNDLKQLSNGLLEQKFATFSNKIKYPDDSKISIQSILDSISDEMTKIKSPDNIKTLTEFLIKLHNITSLKNENQSSLLGNLSLKITESKLPLNVTQAALKALQQYYYLRQENLWFRSLVARPELDEKEKLIPLAIAEALSNLFDAEGKVGNHHLPLIQNISPKFDPENKKHKLKLLLWYLNNISLKEDQALLDMVKKFVSNEQEINADYINEINNIIKLNLERSVLRNSNQTFSLMEDAQCEFLFKQAHRKIVNGIYTCEQRVSTHPELKDATEILTTFGKAQIVETDRLLKKPDIKSTDKLLLLDHAQAVGDVLVNQTPDNYEQCINTSKSLSKRTKLQTAAGIGFAILGTLLLIASIACFVSLKFAPIGVLGIKLSMGALATAGVFLGVGGIASYKYSWKFFSKPTNVSKEVGESVDLIHQTIQKKKQ